ncbi:MAG: uroporphyrinogen decarboxylase family protein [Sphaerochaeta sp.]|nr:uroporphyrinogen decarboxylase family protein [Sphaerochaeta sp.]
MRINSRERILSVLAGKKSDQVPFDIWYTPEIKRMLMDHFRVSDEQQLWRILKIDKIVMLDAPYKDMPDAIHDSEGRTLSCNEWGSRILNVSHSSDGSYEEVVFYPLAEAETIEELDAHTWPDPDQFDYHSLLDSCNRHDEWVRMLSFISLFEIYCKLRPMDLSLMDLYAEPELADHIIDKIFTIQKQYIEKAFEVCGDAIDVVYLSDDMGMQDRQLISVEVWQDRFGEQYRALIELIHSKGAYVLYHSDGAAFPIIEQMVALGVDVINPIQHVCPGMECEHLIEAFGSRVAFHGAVENQQVLPFGTPDEVVSEVRKNIKTLGAHGRYICAPCHNLQPGTPLENILALYRCDRSW